MTDDTPDEDAPEVSEPDPERLGEALLAVQVEAKAVQADAINEGFKRNGKPSKYVPLETLMPAILPLLNKHGLVWITRPIEGPMLNYHLLHVESEESITGTMPLLGVSNMQQLGGAITYARRQSLMAVLGLVAEKDDDGEKSSKRPSGDDRPLPKAKRENMAAQIEASGKDLQVILTSVGAESLEAVTVAQAKQIAALL
jgi:hypothetical protein